MKLITRTLGTAGATVALAGAGVVIAGSASAADTGIPVLEAIKQCESGGSYTAQNPTSTASGAYQFLDSTWQGMDAAAGYARAVDAPESVQDAAAIELYTEQGTTPWLASASCWQGMGFESTSGSGEMATATDTTSADTGTAATVGDTSTTTAAGDAGGAPAQQAGPASRNGGAEGAAGAYGAGRGGGAAGDCSR
ncbi:putative secreted protein [Serinicoccus hydrothermalis]|uniref:Putative secreted protein n=1 Tax=Serinicoccus hydrothermalis TaxID=1758689 RepID=A0A1B1NDR2_9MICO|nr:transglycosylase family protein [Serinicoccus hydrothermalis]ANS79556.1 putative secreted protein [Serinicoccus hydrothermalis]